MGFKLKGINRKMKELGAMICEVDAKILKVNVHLILLTYFAKADHKTPYEGLLRRTENLNARVDLQTR